jgi:hypothetical protein
MKPSYHIMASAGVSLGYQVAMHSWPATLGCFLSGVLIDVDHYAEYWILKKEFPFKYKDLVHFCHKDNGDKVYLLFHAYEYLFILWFAIYLFSLGKMWIGITVGLTTHIMCDQFTNPIKPLFYFLTYRYKNHFKKSELMTGRYAKSF